VIVDRSRAWDGTGPSFRHGARDGIHVDDCVEETDTDEGVKWEFISERERAAFQRVPDFIFYSGILWLFFRLCAV
jgi:hypothetical protein